MAFPILLFASASYKAFAGLCPFWTIQDINNGGKLPFLGRACVGDLMESIDSSNTSFKASKETSQIGGHAIVKTSKSLSFASLKRKCLLFLTQRLGNGSYTGQKAL